VLHVAAVLDHSKEALERRLTQQLRQFAFLLGRLEPELFAHLLADVEKVGVVEPRFAGDPNWPTVCDFAFSFDATKSARFGFYFPILIALSDSF